MNKFAIFLATGAYSGYFPVAPGTAGTVVAIPLYLFLSKSGPYVYLVFTLFLLPLSFWSAGLAEQIFGAKDSGFIVVDEIIGFLVAMFMVPSHTANIIAGFLLFRFFDILKIFPANLVESLGGGIGVVADDIVAGIYAGLSLRILAYTEIL